ncbi:FMN reductase [Kribbella deserti]|uniref:FMN reductase n=1 Tax=Kribbella deserti TaxID=1926257 RepID=A0ABV6QXW7_9ACTN
MTTRTIVVITAGLTQPSSTRLLADRLAAASRDALDGQGIEHKVVTVELRQLAQDLTNNLLTGFPSASLREVLDEVARADGLIAVTPTFSASYNGLFKMFFDVLDEGLLAGKPVLIGATGGTERHSLVLDFALRPLFTYLRAVVVPTGVYAASPDWGAGASGLHERIDRAAGEFAKLVINTEPAAKIDPYATPTPFAQLLGE